ncbi:MAG: molybdopterin-dependent oxidoreductase [Oscillospiraceae bacterium]|nr:molybdopterin-dependent oxidoreductase [Oscillospiraceae bacterium]
MALEDILDRRFSRRDFLKGSMAATAAVAGLGAVSREGRLAAAEETVAPKEHAPIVDQDEGGKWIAAACWHNCGGRCMNRVLIKDGTVVRQKTDDTHPDSPDYPQQRGCVRGKAQQQQCFGADRLKYPMKRKHWSPDEPNGDLRGRDEWERISWNEAIRYVADQYKTIKEKYGNQAFLTGSWGSYSENIPLMYYGGHTSVADSTSYGTFLLNTHKTIGMGRNGRNGNNDRYDMLNADTVIFLSMNPAWSNPGTPMTQYTRAKEAGVKFIAIDPMYSASAQALDAAWVPVRTGTDTALLLGVAHEMLRLDAEEGDIVDWDFLKKYTVGFDADSEKAPNLKDDVNFRDYLEGKYDGIVKDAAWASSISGTPVDRITMLARALGKKNNVWLLYCFAAARNNGSENLPQMILTVGAMGGHMAKPGNCVGLNYYNSANGGPRLVNAGGSGLPATPDNGVPGIIAGPQVWDAVLTGKYHMIGDYYGYTAEGLGEGRDMECDIHCITNVDEHAYLQSGPNMKKGIEAYRKVDFVVSKAQFLNAPAKYSDIVLPVTTYWELPGGIAGNTDREFLYCYSQVTEPKYESKTDQEIDSLIMEALGLDPKEAYPISEKQQFFNAIKGSTVVDEKKAAADGTMEYIPLVTITQEEIDEWGVEGEPQEGIISLNDFIDHGYQVERRPDDAFCGQFGYAAFISDPEANPLATASGKFEITSQTKADFFNGFGFIDWDYKPYPEYITPTTGFETTFKDKVIGGEKGEFPYLLYNIHYLRRSHTTLNNVPWLREAWPNPVFINASDAREKVIASGDTVLISTRTAQSLRKACVMEGLMPGVVSIPHGAWAVIDEETGIDAGGSDNYLLGNEITGSGITPYNNINCNIEKYDGPALEDDVYTDSRIVDL